MKTTIEIVEFFALSASQHRLLAWLSKKDNVDFRYTPTLKISLY